MNRISESSVDEISRLDALLIDEALQGLSSAEQVELDRLLAIHPDADRDAYGLLVAECDLSQPGDGEPLPNELRLKLSSQAVPFALPVPTAVPDAAPTIAASAVPLTGRWSAATPWLGWAVAAGLLLGFMITPNPTNSQPVSEQMLQRVGDAVRWGWQPQGKVPCAGHVVFSPRRQKGLVVFRGLPANDPNKWQYQLWIVDRGRPGDHPVDGGVFNVCHEDPRVPCVIVFDPKLPVSDPQGFALTREQPGGVVVSQQNDLIAIAEPDDDE